MKMLTAIEARTKANAESSKLSPIVLALINRKIKKACRKGLTQVSIQIGLIPLEYHHVEHVLSVLKENGYSCSAEQLKTSWEQPADWTFTIKW